MAVDAQGPTKARPYVERAGASFTSLIDEENVLGKLLSAKAIPNGVLIDESGVIQYMRLGGFDIRKAETRAMVESWLNGAPITEASPQKNVTLKQEALASFERGLAHYRAGGRTEAAREWRRAVEQDPENLIIRKQLWALEHPEKFYDGDVDYGWQREQIAKGL